MHLNFRQADKGDIAALVRLLADDELGTQREDLTNPLNQRYTDTFQHISKDPNNELTVVEADGELIGMLQLTFIPYLTHTGTWRCLIEGVRVAETHRGKGLGAEFFHWAFRRAREKNCNIVQLTSDKQRLDAIRFYESLGFKATHQGFKLKL